VGGVGPGVGGVGLGGGGGLGLGGGEVSFVNDIILETVLIVKISNINSFNKIILFIYNNQYLKYLVFGAINASHIPFNDSSSLNIRESQ